MAAGIECIWTIYLVRCKKAGRVENLGVDGLAISSWSIGMLATYKYGLIKKCHSTGEDSSYNEAKVYGSIDVGGL